VATRAYVEEIGGILNLEPPPTIRAQALRKSVVAFTHLVSRQNSPAIVPIPVEDAFVIAVERHTLPATNVWLNGRQKIKDECTEGSFTFVNLNVELAWEMSGDFDSVHMYFPRTALTAISEEIGGPAVESLGLLFEKSTDDAVVRSLSQALLPAFENPERANRLFTDHVGMAVLTHVLQAYGGAQRQLVQGGLAPWQVRRAKEMLVARLDGETPLHELARECGLSRSHFARAFKKSTGKPPHRWLIERRIERARELLRESSLSLAEIADKCGFADQSHFTRAFSAAMGVVPSEWRRVRRS